MCTLKIINYTFIQNHADDDNPITTHKQLLFCSQPRVLIKCTATA